METIILKNRKTTIAGIIISCLLLFSVLFTGLITQQFGIPRISGTSLLISRILFWACLFFVWQYSVKVEQQNMLLWQDRKYEKVYYILSVIGIFGAMIVSMIIVKLPLTKLGLKDSTVITDVIDIFRHYPLLMIFTCVTAGVIEELIFRGYMLPRLIALSGSTVVSVILSSLLFGLLHMGYGTILNIVGPLVIGVIFSIYYIKFRNINVLIFCHILWDLLAMLLRMKFGK